MFAEAPRACSQECADSRLASGGAGCRGIAFAGEGLIEVTIDGERVALNSGGDAANAASMCAALGAPTQLFGRVGSDALGQRLVKSWHAGGIDLSNLVVDPEASTGLYVNQVPGAPGTARGGFSYWRRGSAGSRWSPADLENLAVLSGIGTIVVTGITATVSESCANAVWELIEAARSRSIVVVCILNYRAALSPDPTGLAALALAADVLIASVEDLVVTFPAASSAQVFQRMQGPAPELVVTAGAAGATVTWSGDSVRQRAPIVRVRDTVGAGDALAGAYVCARFHYEYPPAEALAWGVAAASLSVQRSGCAASYPDAAATAIARDALPSHSKSRRTFTLRG